MQQSAQKRGQGGVIDATSEVLGALPNGLEGAYQGGNQVEEVSRASVGQRLLGQLPDAFIRVEARGRSRENGPGGGEGRDERGPGSAVRCGVALRPIRRRCGHASDVRGHRETSRPPAAECS